LLVLDHKGFAALVALAIAIVGDDNQVRAAFWTVDG
jgi:hypothetical protein